MGTRVRASRYGIRSCSGVSLWDSRMFGRVLSRVLMLVLAQAIRPMPSAAAKASGSPKAVAAAPLRRLPSTATVPGRTIMQYVMLHNPGNTVNSQRRRFYASIAHGAKWINFFVLATFATGPGDFTDSHAIQPASGGMYPAVLREVNEYGTFSDIVAAGAPQAQGAKAAIVFSSTADMYLDDFGTTGAARPSP